MTSLKLSLHKEILSMKSLKNLAFVIVAFVFISCEQTNESVRLQGMVFGTSYSIIYYDND